MCSKNKLCNYANEMQCVLLNVTMSKFLAQKRTHIINHHLPKTWIIKKAQQTRIEHKKSHFTSLASRTRIWTTPPHSTPAKKKRGGNINMK
jgi:hypothetical protein